MYSGSFTALITPFTSDGVIDERAFQRFVAWQIESGSNGVVPAGTTGEAATLTRDERKRLIHLCVEAAKDNIIVMAGVGSNSTEEAKVLAQDAEKAGADAALVITPYYNKPTREGLFLHYKSVHDACRIPIFAYTVPGRCGISLSLSVLKKLCGLPRFAGIKDATGDLVRPLQTRCALGENFYQFSGEDASVVAFLAQGGHGCISVTANVAPALCADLHRAWKQGDRDKVAVIRDRLFPVHDALFCETSPGPVKYATSLLGYGTDSVRLPLVAASPAARDHVGAALHRAGLLESV